jgi:hypothetical protein
MDIQNHFMGIKKFQILTVTIFWSGFDSRDVNFITFF